MRLLFAAFGILLALCEARAQDVTINLDRVARAAYCAGYEKALENFVSHDTVTLCNSPHANPSLCSSTRAVLFSIQKLRRRLSAYVLSITSVSDAAIMTASTAITTGQHDFASCISGNDCHSLKIRCDQVLPY
ncbi:hypothetical protein MHY1_00470 [Methylovirgula sp. HY1]|nr:hypothetical protein MHY1_00470 [Methylovirgula sp. HY1]